MIMDNMSTLNPHEALWQIARDFEVKVLAESRLNGLLGDLGIGDAKLRKIFRCALNDRIGAKLIDMKGDEVEHRMIKIDILKHTFKEDNFFQEEIACYVVDCFAYALGYVNAPDIYESKSETQPQGTNTPDYVAYDDGHYRGDFNERNERDGFGLFEREDSSRYIGEWLDDSRHGFGAFMNAFMETYAGQWRYNKCEGIGVKRWKDGVCYTGQWRNGTITGWGMMFSPSGAHTFGHYTDGVLNGLGLYFTPEGDFYVSRWRDGTQVNSGVHFDADGIIIDKP